MEGVIKTVKIDKGFGFISANGGKEYFFHASGCVDDFKTFHEGQRVQFEEEESTKGPRAMGVQAVAV